jgi:PII-like signaling protein
MTTEALKLTTYFGERDRTEDHLLADELLDLYGAHAMRGSILLRGIEGFGLKHHLHTDRLLTLSEDLPVVSIAVDTADKVEGLLADVMQIKRRGLVTLERTRILARDGQDATLSPELSDAAKLTVYLGRQERVLGTPAFVAVCDLLYRREIAGATALLGVDGTVHGRRERARFFSRNAEVPMMVIAVGSGERIARVVPELAALLRDPLITLERVGLCKRDGQLLRGPPELPAHDPEGMGLWQKLMVYTSEAARYEGRPIHSELVRRLRQTGASGATSLRGVWGFHGDHQPHGDRFFQVRRNVPTVSIVVDSPERIAASFDIVDELTSERGLVTVEMVPAMTAMAVDRQRGGLRLARHDY